MFRYKKSVPVSYERQGYIYFSSLLYREMPEKAQRKILNLCMECGGGDYYRALFEFVTTDAQPLPLDARADRAEVLRRFPTETVTGLRPCVRCRRKGATAHRRPNTHYSISRVRTRA